MLKTVKNEIWLAKSFKNKMASSSEKQSRKLHKCDSLWEVATTKFWI